MATGRADDNRSQSLTNCTKNQILIRYLSCCYFHSGMQSEKSFTYFSKHSRGRSSSQRILTQGTAPFTVWAKFRYKRKVSIHRSEPVCNYYTEIIDTVWHCTLLWNCWQHFAKTQFSVCVYSLVSCKASHTWDFCFVIHRYQSER